MIRMVLAFLIVYGTVGGIETDRYWTWLQPAALFAIAGLTGFTVWLDGTWARITEQD